MKTGLSELERCEVAKAVADGAYPSRAQYARRVRLRDAGVLGIIWPGRWYVTERGLSLMGQRFAETIGNGLQNDHRPYQPSR